MLSTLIMSCSYLKFLIVLLVILVQAEIINCKENSTKITECGGVIRVSSSKPIDFDVKMKVSVYNYDFCVWTIVPEDEISTYQFYNYKGQDFGHHDGPILYGWKNNIYGFQGYPLDSSVENFTYPSTSHLFLAISAFYVDNKSRSFSLSLVGTKIPNSPSLHILRKLENNYAYYRKSLQGSFSIPFAPSKKYGNDLDLSLVIPAQYTQNSNFWINLRVLNIQMDIYDEVYILTLLPYWQFNRTNGGLQSIGPITGKQLGILDSATTNSSYPRILYFRSDEIRRGRGLTVEWDAVEVFMLPAYSFDNGN